VRNASLHGPEIDRPLRRVEHFVEVHRQAG